MTRRVLEVTRRVSIGDNANCSAEPPTDDRPWVLAFHTAMALLWVTVMWLWVTAMIHNGADSASVVICSAFLGLGLMALWVVLNESFKGYTESHLRREIEQCETDTRYRKCDLDVANGGTERMKRELAVKQCEVQQASLEERLASLRAFRAKVRRLFRRG